MLAWIDLTTAGLALEIVGASYLTLGLVGRPQSIVARIVESSRRDQEPQDQAEVRREYEQATETVRTAIGLLGILSGFLLQLIYVIAQAAGAEGGATGCGEAIWAGLVAGICGLLFWLTAEYLLRPTLMKTLLWRVAHAEGELVVEREQAHWVMARLHAFGKQLGEEEREGDTQADLVKRAFDRVP